MSITKKTVGNCQVVESVGKNRRAVTIKPKGFWIDSISVMQESSYGDKPVWQDPTYNAGSGGTDGTLHPIEELEMNTEGNKLAQEYLRIWGSDSGMACDA